MSHSGGLVQERRNSIANAMELRLSCTNPLIMKVYSEVNIVAADGLSRHSANQVFLHNECTV